MRLFEENDIFATWQSHLERIGAPPFEVNLPKASHYAEMLRYLEVPEEDIPGVISSAPGREADPGVWWYLERSVHSLSLHINSVDAPPRIPPLRDVNDRRYRYFFVHVYTAAMPHILAWFKQHRIPEHIVQASLADLGRNVRVHRKRHGQGGLGTAWWLMLHFRGMIYQLGRLQFERSRIGETMATHISAAGGTCSPDTPALSLHIPDFSGPMTPGACDASIDMARAFFKSFFPDEDYQIAYCNSWLLDPQLRDYLSPESNIIRFQDRFALAPGGYDVNNSIVQFVFGSTLDRIDELPQRSSLERAIVQHIKAGGTWQGRSGWFLFE